MSSVTDHEHFMKLALQLARRGMGWVSPNPLVGAVIVKNNVVIGRGYHERFGGHHAEINALQQAGSEAYGATMYVTLEPCCHYGKTPPCTDAIITSGITRIFVGMVDPNPAVSGRGIQKLRMAGITVETGLLEEQCRLLNEAFIKYITRNVPFVTLKAGLTLDGNIATVTGDSKWITCEHSRRYVHKIRSEVDAVMVGIGTVLADNPRLTARLSEKSVKNPLRVIVDEKLRIPLSSKVLQTKLAQGTLLATSPALAQSRKARQIQATGAQIFSVPLKRGLIDLKALIKKLGAMGIASLLIEGGSELNASALAAEIVDKIMFFYAPKIIGGRKAIHVVGGKGIRKIAKAITLSNMTIKRIGSDFLVTGYVQPRT
ncbi:MAG: bifunctional diaminohydroxyphosphoribosylaminopyrimidine deaminase/5-amino-6-(5-phosphoribosylamino)uracil reductase RibD [Desulfobacterota bacterium]|nr:bifunctional diaminohydroxyphosphoribosylaminopyrimidine deaminase/5-amino-6-(5-phosphoribosylamino)uracil reductase RibD [Thermodesulfobacteriota bacterium]